MSEYTAGVHWQRDETNGDDRRYSRAHEWRFDGGVTVRASSSPHVVPPPLSVTDAVDPEEAFIASLSSCHMLWFLHIAGDRGFRVDRYDDEATGVLGKNAEGRLAMTEVTLHPRIVFGGERQPSPADLDAMHEEAHEKCFIANSVTTTVRCEAGVPS